MEKDVFHAVLNGAAEIKPAKLSSGRVIVRLNTRVGADLALSISNSEAKKDGKVIEFTLTPEQAREFAKKIIEASQVVNANQYDC